MSSYGKVVKIDFDSGVQNEDRFIGVLVEFENVF